MTLDEQVQISHSITTEADLVLHLRASKGADWQIAEAAFRKEFESFLLRVHELLEAPP
jgi:hypothetical protein